MTGQQLVEKFDNEILIKIYGQTIIRFLWLFILGMGTARFFDELIPFCRKWWNVLLIVGGVVSITKFDYSAGYGIVKTTFVLLAAIGFAYKYPQLNLKKDISFGIFIYHMTVVNAMIALGLTHNMVFFLIATVLSCILGYLSTITIGAFSMRKRVKLVNN